jgi:hypothetical protein
VSVDVTLCDEFDCYSFATDARVELRREAGLQTTPPMPPSVAPPKLAPTPQPVEPSATPKE